MLPLSEVRVLDRNAEALGVPVAQLVENAGRALADVVDGLRGAGPVLALVGPGNNGADGLVAARLLRERGADVVVQAPFAADGWKSGHAARAARGLRVEHDADAARLDAQMARADVVVDALLGAGLSGPLRAPYDAWVQALARHARKVVAADVPTGFGTPTSYAPARTVTFHAAKEGMTRANSGDIIVADVGIPREAALYTGPGEYELYPMPRREQHKGEGGIVLVIGGGPYTGAPAVAGMAALRSGADLAIVLTPKRAWSVIASYSPNLVARPLENDDLDFEDPANRVTLNTWLKKAKSVVVGPGLGLFDATQRAVHHVVERCHAQGVPVVVDADALGAIASRKDLLSKGTVLTPHAREFRTLTQRDLPAHPEARAEIARGAAKELGGVWLVKGPVDVVTDGERVKLNASGHPAMSVGGTGDALAGVVGCLLAKGMRPFDAARVAARLVGEAGEIAVESKSMGLVATDVVEALPAALARGLPRAKQP